MKSFLSAVIVLLISSATFSQTIADTTLYEESVYTVYQSYMQKAAKKKKTARKLVYTGGGMMLVGVTCVIFAITGDNLPFGILGRTIVSAGFVPMVIAYPFIKSSQKWEKRALQIRPSLSFQKINIPAQNMVQQPSVGVVIYL